jgi:hypothetical protein
MWMNNFMPPRNIPYPPEQAYQAFTRSLILQSRQAILTHAIQEWVKQAEPGPSNKFSSLIEYDNLLSWHLMVHWAPSRLYEAG